MTWHTLMPTLLSAAIGGLISGAMAYVAVKVDIAWLRAERKADKEHLVAHEEASEIRFERIEKKVGIDNGDAEFMRRGECAILHTQTVALRAELKQDIDSLKRELRVDMKEVRDALDEMRLDFYGRGNAKKEG